MMAVFVAAFFFSGITVMMMIFIMPISVQSFILIIIITIMSAAFGLGRWREGGSKDKRRLPRAWLQFCLHFAFAFVFFCVCIGVYMSVFFF